MRIPFALLALVLALGSGCGAIRSTVGIIEAEKALKSAHDLGAKELAPFPMTLAEEMLEKAREEAGYAEYSRSWELATEAKKLAEGAAIQARENPVSPPTRMVPLPGREQTPKAEPAVEPVATEPTPEAAPEPEPEPEPTP